MKSTFRTVIAGAVCFVVSTSPIWADTFGEGTNHFTIEFVVIGNPGNTNDATGYGSVGYEYRIGRYEITIDQFTKARNADNNISNGDEDYWNQGEYTTVGTNAPASYVSWYEAAKLCNWLTSSNAYLGAYQFDSGGTLTNINRAAAMGIYGVVYVLPTEDEWYKAAFFKSDASGYTWYASGDSTPGVETDANYGGFGGTYAEPWVVGTGNLENNDTFDMNGNVNEWIESAYDGTLDIMDEVRVFRGGGYMDLVFGLRSSIRGESTPSYEFESMGLRIVAIIQRPLIFIDQLQKGIGLRWPSIAGQDYQVQYSTNLVSTNWFDLGESVVGNGTTNGVVDVTGEMAECFYRVIIE